MKQIENGQEYRKRFKNINEEIVIGLFANLRKQKNHELLLKAIKLLKDRGIDNIKLVFAGDGEQRQKY